MLDQKIFDLIDGVLYGKRTTINKGCEVDNVNLDVCQKCCGVCCKRCGCHYSPNDFKEITFNYLQKEIKKGYISIEWIDGESFYSPGGVYILRARNTGMKIVDNSIERAPCILLTENGCKLSYEQRPSGGKYLIPKVKNDTLLCYSKYDIYECCMEWREHQKVLNELVRYFKNRDYPCSV